MNVKETAEHVIASAKAAWAVVGSTLATSVGFLLDLIPDSIGKFGTLIGIILSIVLIRMHIASTRKIQLEMDIMRRKERERLEAVEHRKEAGEPARRTEDQE